MVEQYRFTNSPVSEYVYLVQRGHNKLDRTSLQTLQYQSMFSSERTQQAGSNSTGLQTFRYQNISTSERIRTARLDQTGLQTLQYQSMFSSERTQVWSNSTDLQTVHYQSMFSSERTQQVRSNSTGTV